MAAYWNGTTKSGHNATNSGLNLNALGKIHLCALVLCESVFYTQIHESEVFLMKEIWNWVQLAFAAVGAFLGWFLGGLDGFLYALIAFVTIDYVTGVLCAIIDKKLSSEIGAKGIFKKVLIFVLVGVAHILDTQILGSAGDSGGVLRTAVIFFYLSNEGVSILENAAHIGLPIPEKLKEVLKQLHGREDGDGK